MCGAQLAQQGVLPQAWISEADEECKRLCVRVCIDTQAKGQGSADIRFDERLDMLFRVREKIFFAKHDEFLSNSHAELKVQVS